MIGASPDPFLVLIRHRQVGKNFWLQQQEFKRMAHKITLRDQIRAILETGTVDQSVDGVMRLVADYLTDKAMPLHVLNIRPPVPFPKLDQSLLDAITIINQARQDVASIMGVDLSEGEGVEMGLESQTGSTATGARATGWLIHKAGRGWYRPNAEGYTDMIDLAGRFSKAEADKYSHPNGKTGPRDGISIKHESELQAGVDLGGNPLPTPALVTDAMVTTARDAWKASRGNNDQAMRAALEAVLGAPPPTDEKLHRQSRDLVLMLVDWFDVQPKSESQIDGAARVTHRRLQRLFK